MKKIIVGISLALNTMLIAAALSFWLGISDPLLIKFMYSMMHKDRMDKFSELEIKGDDIVFLGDSISHNGLWNELFPGIQTRNRGIGADTSGGVLARLSQVTEGRPAKIFLLIGTNDLASRIPASEITTNIGTIVDRIRSESEGTEIFVLSVLPRGAEYRERIESLNSSIRTTISGRAKWIDLYPLFLDPNNGSIIDEFSTDELHPSGKGYTVLRDAIQQYVYDTNQEAERSE